MALNSSPSEFACLEDFTTLLLQQQNCPIEKDVFKHLWKVYLLNPEGENETQIEEKRAQNRIALQLLRFATKINPGFLEDKKHALMDHTRKISQQADVDWLLFREGLITFQRLVTIVEVDDVTFLNNCIKSLIKYRFCKRKTDWFCAAEEVVNAIFGLLDFPERHSEYLIHELSKGLTSDIPDEECPSKSTHNDFIL